MKINDPNLSPLGAAAMAGAQQAQRSAPAQGNASTGSTSSSSSSSSASDDVHLSELVRSLRSLAADSPERQTKIEQLARSYASGTYTVDAQATAGAMIDDATKR
jgi:flagellar biosynthesis anti-sigma factor FlgM